MLRDSRLLTADKHPTTLVFCVCCTQAESGLCAVSGRPGSPARIGVSIVDITTGINAHGAIVQALFERERTNRGQALKTSLFASASELMSVPYLQYKVRSVITPTGVPSRLHALLASPR